MSSREEHGSGGFWGGTTLSGILSGLLVLFTTLVLVSIAYFAFAVLVSVIWYCGDRFLLNRSRSCPELKIGPDGEVCEDFSRVNRADFVAVLVWMKYGIYRVCSVFLISLVLIAIVQMKWW